jgi:hypothetical protein
MTMTDNHHQPGGELRLPDPPDFPERTRTPRLAPEHRVRMDRYEERRRIVEYLKQRPLQPLHYSSIADALGMNRDVTADCLTAIVGRGYDRNVKRPARGMYVYDQAGEYETWYAKPRRRKAEEAPDSPVGASEPAAAGKVPDDRLLILERLAPVPDTEGAWLARDESGALWTLRPFEVRL